MDKEVDGLESLVKTKKKAAEAQRDETNEAMESRGLKESGNIRVHGDSG